MKKICFAFNHLQFSDGIARSVIGIANALAQREDVQVTLRPIFKCDTAMIPLLSEKVLLKPLFNGYFRGLSQLIYRLPRKFLHHMIFNGDYDIEIGFQYLVSTKAVVGGQKTSDTRRYIWMHTYDDGLVMKSAYLQADKMVCVSKNNQARLDKELDGKVPVEVCYNPIDDAIIQHQAMTSTDLVRPNKLLLVSVGRLSPEKGFERLLHILAHLVREGHDFHFWLIGHGPEEKRLKALVLELGLSEQVALLGEQSNPHQYTVQADLFVCSSFAEGYSTACCEASILGVPVLSTAVSGAEEIIADAQAGMVVGLDDRSLYRGLKKALTIPTLIPQWQAILKETRKNFYYETRVAQLYHVLELED